jgi:hypothetical protein
LIQIPAAGTLLVTGRAKSGSFPYPAVRVGSQVLSMQQGVVGGGSYFAFSLDVVIPVSAGTVTVSLENLGVDNIGQAVALYVPASN